MRLLQIVLAVVALAGLAGCEVVGTIFEAGMWFGIVIVLAILGFVAFLVMKARR